MAGHDHGAAQRMQELLAMGPTGRMKWPDAVGPGEFTVPISHHFTPEVILAAVIPLPPLLFVWSSAVNKAAR
jgi:hypothetical protein